MTSLCEDLQKLTDKYASDRLEAEYNALIKLLKDSARQGYNGVQIDSDSIPNDLLSRLKNEPGITVIIKFDNTVLEINWARDGEQVNPTNIRRTW